MANEIDTDHAPSYSSSRHIGAVNARMNIHRALQLFWHKQIGSVPQFSDYNPSSLCYCPTVWPSVFLYPRSVCRIDSTVLVILQIGFHLSTNKFELGINIRIISSYVDVQRTAQTLVFISELVFHQTPSKIQELEDSEVVGKGSTVPPQVYY